MIVDYNATKTFTESLVIDDPGNCAIYGFGSFRDGKVLLPGDFYMIIKTIMGKTTFIKWGPMLPDITALPNSFKLEIKTSSYKESTIAKEIQGFINDSFKGIQSAEVLEVEEALDNLPDIDNFIATLD